MIPPCARRSKPRMRKLLGAILCAFALAHSPALAAPHVAESRPEAYYLDAGTISPTLIAPPPAEGSAAWKREIKGIIALQKLATKEELRKAEAEIHMSPEMVAEALSPAVSRAEYPRLFALLDRAGEDSRAVNHAVKNYWNTRRPYLASGEVRALIRAHANPAYPSGHTMGARVWAELLAQFFPERQAALRARAAEIARHRVIVGMHYPSDVEGGRMLAMLLLGALSQSEEFRADFDAAMREVREKRGRE